MKIFSLVLLVMLVPPLFAVSGVAQQKQQGGAGNGYHPQAKYQGEYKSNLIFLQTYAKRYLATSIRTGQLSETILSSALDQLNSEGKWQGSLNPDGSCGINSIESPEWATGNRINYDEGSGQRRELIVENSLLKRRAPKIW